VRRKGNSIRTYLAAILAAIAMAVPAGAQAGDISSIRVDNFGKVNERYYRGAQPAGRDYTDLATLGVKTIINLTSDDAQADEPALAVAAGMRYVQIPMSTHTAPTPAQLAQFLGIVNDPASQPVYVHCVGGRHRTGVMTAAYRMTQEAWTSDRAFQEMKQYKFGADFLHPEFKTFVFGYRAPAANAVAATKAGS
jgi:protein tyrosine/serine phosphatase